MSTDTPWKTRVTDKLRELIPGALVLTIAGSIWLIGQTRESEADIIDAFAAPIYHPSLADLEYEPEEETGDFLSDEDWLEDHQSVMVPAPTWDAETSAAE